MSKKFQKNGFFEWLIVSGKNCESDPESSIPDKYFKKPQPPRKRRRKRFEKGTQTEFQKQFKTVETIMIQTDPPPPNDDHRMYLLIFFTGFLFGIVSKEMKLRMI